MGEGSPLLIAATIWCSEAADRKSDSGSVLPCKEISSPRISSDAMTGLKDTSFSFLYDCQEELERETVIACKKFVPASDPRRH